MGVTDLKRIIQARRIMFLWYILTRKEDDLLLRFFKAQCRKPSKNDWCQTVRKDLEELEIEEDFDQLKKYSKDQLSKLVREAYKSKAFEDLLLKQENYSKGRNLMYGELKMRRYLKTRSLSKEQASLAFRLRTRMVSGIKANFRNSFKDDMSCQFCSSGAEDNQEHLVVCSSLNNDNITVQEYRTVFGSDEEKIATVTKKIEKILQHRKELQEINAARMSTQ